ncbi:MAG: inositol monophosphatase family protein [Burkholderiaceae bacterium]
MSSLHPMLNTAVKAARRAGSIINRASLDLERVKVSRKAHNDFVTETDEAAENAIIDVLLTAYPDHRILAEESGRTAGAQGVAKGSDSSVSAMDNEAENLWIIDPLDGTTNFIHGFPQYCVSIGLLQRGVVTQAVIYDPNRNDLFVATKGRGAFLNDRRLRVSKRHRMNEALLGTGFPFKNLETLDRYLAMFRLMTAQSAGIRRPGAAALDLAYVAAGRLDGFFEVGLMPWDIAAGSLLVTEAGGLIGDFQGDPEYLHTGDVLAGTPKIFGQLVGTLGPLFPKRSPQ